MLCSPVILSYVLMENYTTPKMQVQPISNKMYIILTPSLSPRPDVSIHFVLRPPSIFRVGAVDLTFKADCKNRKLYKLLSSLSEQNLRKYVDKEHA